MVSSYKTRLSTFEISTLIAYFESRDSSPIVADLQFIGENGTESSRLVRLTKADCTREKINREPLQHLLKTQTSDRVDLENDEASPKSVTDKGDESTRVSESMIFFLKMSLFPSKLSCEDLKFKSRSVLTSARSALACASEICIVMTINCNSRCKASFMFSDLTTLRNRSASISTD